VHKPHAQRERKSTGQKRLLGIGLLATLLGEKDSVDVGEDTTLSDGDTGQELAQLLVIADSELNVTGDDTGLLVVASGIASQFEDLSGEVLKDGSQVNGSTSADTVCVLL
jgi:hypothetical protein